MPSHQAQAGTVVYQMKVTLKYSKPPIWRRFQVMSDTTLAKLHDVLQIVMGWEDEHLHAFTSAGKRYGPPEPDLLFGMGPRQINERRVKLGQVISGEKARLSYEYDFGDSWEHAILVEKALAVEPGAHYPVCLTGKLACPPEDCGGIFGYYQLLETLENPDDPEYEDMREWAGEDFDPNVFDLDAINRKLRKLR